MQTPAHTHKMKLWILHYFILEALVISQMTCLKYQLEMLFKKKAKQKEFNLKIYTPLIYWILLNLFTNADAKWVLRNNPELLTFHFVFSISLLFNLFLMV